MKAVGRVLQEIVDAVRNLWSNSGVPSPSGSAMAYAAHALLVLILIALVGLLGWAFYRLWRSYQRPSSVPADPLPPTPNLEDEDVRADELPGDEWIRLARELLARGDLRLALRALYLATLASLAERNLITIARFKSNHDYERELARRGHALAELLGLFSQNLAVFERVWYGRHEVSSGMLDEFSGNVDRIKAA